MKIKKAKKKPSAKVKDIKPRKNPKGGIGMLLPAVQKATIANASGGNQFHS